MSEKVNYIGPIKIRPGRTGNIPDIDVEETTEMSPNHSTKRKRNFLKEFIKDYLNNSNLHGLKYIGEKERTYPEKIFWLFVFICCVILCAGMIRKVWIKWNVSPVIVTFAENPTPVWQIPYPAVTVCLETKAMQRKFNFTKYYHLYRDPDSYSNMTVEDRNLYEDISMVCDDHLAPRTGRNFSDGAETIANIKEVSPNLTETFFGCKWQDLPSQNCSDLLSTIVTEEGICYTFNSLAAEDLFRTENLNKDYELLEQYKTTKSWNLENGYAPDTPVETYPHRGSGFGVKSGFTFVLQSHIHDQDYLCRGPVQGFKVLLHNPAELPRLSQQYFRSPLGQEVIVAVKPKMMTTSVGLRSYDPSRRLCYFSDERYLRYFKVYTQANCEVECLSNFTYARCGCVHFGVPHSEDMAVCSAGNMACIKKAQMELVNIEIESAMGSTADDSINKAREVSQHCQCLPSCTSIEYEAETSQAVFDWSALFRAYNYDLPEDLINVTSGRVLIFFKEPQFITSRRSELYGLPDFLASCGGLLGLFMGFSIMSVVEIVYFMTLRLCCLYAQRQNKRVMEFPRDGDSKKY